MDTTKNEHEGLCISKEEIIEYFKDEPKYTKPMILSAIEGCCNGEITKKEKESFLACVKERIQMIYLANYKPGGAK